MENKTRPYDLHVLICTNSRAGSPDSTAPKKSCSPLGSDHLRADLKDWLKAEIASRPLLKGKFRARVNGSGCLDFCSQGIAMAIYPAGKFLLSVKNDESDRTKIKDAIKEYLDEAERTLASSW